VEVLHCVEPSSGLPENQQEAVASDRLIKGEHRQEGRGLPAKGYALAEFWGRVPDAGGEKKNSRRKATKSRRERSGGEGKKSWAVGIRQYRKGRGGKRV